MATLKIKILFWPKNNPQNHISQTIRVICPEISKITLYMRSQRKPIWNGKGYSGLKDLSRLNENMKFVAKIIISNFDITKIFQFY